jgi:hypothetical protein
MMDGSTFKGVGRFFICIGILIGFLLVAVGSCVAHHVHVELR